MKIGIVTLIGRHRNYGGTLQNYAVQKILRNLGHESDTLTPADERCKFEDNKVRYIKERIAFWAGRYGRYFAFLFKNVRFFNFLNWERKHIKERFVAKKTTLPSSLNSQYDKFIVGSDQVWNWNFMGIHTPNYFLEFCDDNKKIALSASIGVDNIPESLHETYKKGLSGFSNISVRENEAVDQIKEIIDKDVTVLLDPTMIVTADEWTSVSERSARPDKKYIATYFLGRNENRDEIYAFARENGFEVCELYNRDFKKLHASNPGQFIDLIKNAELVCTDSFHGMVFSILFSCPFVGYIRNGGGYNNMISRVNTLLGRFNLTNRIRSECPQSEWLKCDFSEVSEILESERKRYIEWLTKALETE